jgi:hypothetical protein
MNVLVGHTGIIGSQILTIGSNSLSRFNNKTWDKDGLKNILVDSVRNIESIIWAAGKSKWYDSKLICDSEIQLFKDFLNLLDGSKSLKKLSIISSLGKLFENSKDHIITENSIPGPNTYYAEMKIEIESLLKSFGEGSNVKTNVFRATNVYDFRQTPSSRHGLISNIARNIMSNGTLDLIIDQNRSLNFISSSQLAKLALDTHFDEISVVSHNIFHFATEQNLSFKLIVDSLKRAGHELQFKSVNGKILHGNDKIFKSNHKHLQGIPSNVLRDLISYIDGQ